MTNHLPKSSLKKLLFLKQYENIWADDLEQRTLSIGSNFNKKKGIFRDYLFTDMTLEQVGFKWQLSKERTRQCVAQISRYCFLKIISKNIITREEYYSGYF